MATDNTAAKIRKRDTGGQGNRGEFAAVQRSETQVEVPEQTPPEAIDLPRDVVKMCHFYGLSDLQATRQADGSLHVSARGWIITDHFEEDDIDPDLLCQQINQYHPNAETHIEDAGQDLQPWDDVVYSLSVTPEGEDADSIDQAIFDHPLAGPWDYEAEREIWEGAKTKTALRKAESAMDDFAERSRNSHQTPVQARARAAYMIYRDAAHAESREAIDGLRDLGSRHGAAYVSFPIGDDIDDSALLSAHPVFWDSDGEAMDWNENPQIENGGEYAAWMFADRDEVIVADLAPNVREDPELDALSERTDHAYIYRCSPEQEEAL